MLELAALQQALTQRVNRLRCLQRLLVSKRFLDVYRRADTVQRDSVHKYIRGDSDAAVEQWIATIERDTRNFEELPVRDLRRLASSLGVSGYNFLARASLLSEIRKARVRYDDVGRYLEESGVAPGGDGGADDVCRCVEGPLRADEAGRPRDDLPGEDAGPTRIPGRCARGPVQGCRVHLETCTA